MTRRRGDGQLTIADAFSRAEASKTVPVCSALSDAEPDVAADGGSCAADPAVVSSSGLDGAAILDSVADSAATGTLPTPARQVTDIGKLFLDAEASSTSGASGLAAYACRWSLETASREEKAFFLEHHFRPEEGFEFPAREERKTADHTSKRYFQRHWLQKYKWLVYNGGFCLPCVLFASREAAEKGGPLYCRPLITFTRASTVLSKHDGQMTHLSAIPKADAFRSTWSVRQPDVYQQLHDVHAVQAGENVEKLRSIIKVIELCGRQNIPLRGHRESGFSLDLSQPLPRNPGNFLALVRFRLEAGDQRLLQDLHMSQMAKQSGGKKVTYLSPGIPNEIIECCGCTIREQVLSEVKAAKFYTVRVDEAADSANWEQLPLVLRFVDNLPEIREELVDFVRCE